MERSAADVAKFIEEILELAESAPHLFSGTAEGLVGLLMGMDTVLRFCQANSATNSLHGFNRAWETKGFGEATFLSVVNDRLDQRGIEAPTEKARMREIIKLWQEVRA
ncbi:hypothetical protein PLANPX_2848 [Lacipirellula parvula]|uniref:Uncharacterized protein n=1 Tax=Lacipirellula parvula TaxID=2650471 RepID=A0A5K7XG38_9BACT|nr:hypothetical protein PLANPX_2848 [Lacipirellula parvula]